MLITMPSAPLMSATAIKLLIVFICVPLTLAFLRLRLEIRRLHVKCSALICRALSCLFLRRGRHGLWMFLEKLIHLSIEAFRVLACLATDPVDQDEVILPNELREQPARFVVIAMVPQVGIDRFGPDNLRRVLSDDLCQHLVRALSVGVSETIYGFCLQLRSAGLLNVLSFN